MKSTNYYIWIIFFSITLLCGCSKDKDEVSPLQGTYLGSNLELSINGVTLNNRVVGINNDGALILQYIIPGEVVIDIPLNNNNGKLSGETSISSGTISVQGELNKGKLIIDITYKINNPIIGTWDLSPLKTNVNNDIISSPVFIDAEPASATVSFLGKELTLAEISYMLESFLSEYLKAIKSITFRDDGFVVATFSDSKLGSTPVGLIQYCVKNKMLYLMPNLSDIYVLITNETQSRSELDVLSEILNLLTEGIPFIYNIENNELKIYTNKQIMLPYFEILKEILPFLPDDNRLIKTIETYFSDIYSLVNNCTKFSIGITCDKNS